MYEWIPPSDEYYYHFWEIITTILEFDSNDKMGVKNSMSNKILIDPENSDHLRYKKELDICLDKCEGTPSNVSINFDHPIPIVSVLKKTYVKCILFYS